MNRNCDRATVAGCVQSIRKLIRESAAFTVNALLNCGVLQFMRGTSVVNLLPECSLLLNRAPQALHKRI
ncbi:hypothetical protein [uncultured Nostoc sp.]|uniref:hypothetical protein n=1 Tax=uncultured Nostoc sp. TaxID=340711 RepID=UPI0035CC5288